MNKREREKLNMLLAEESDLKCQMERKVNALQEEVDKFNNGKALERHPDNDVAVYMYYSFAAKHSNPESLLYIIHLTSVYSYIQARLETIEMLKLLFPPDNTESEILRLAAVLEERDRKRGIEC